MITVDASDRIRLSVDIGKRAGFRPGQKLAVITSGNSDTFTIIPASKISKGAKSARYSVEQDGRIRIAKSTLSSLGIKTGKRKSPIHDVSKGRIQVSI